jgi:hypothetical protein
MLSARRRLAQAVRRADAHPVEAATQSLPVLPLRLITHAGQPRNLPRWVGESARCAPYADHAPSHRTAVSGWVRRHHSPIAAPDPRAAIPSRAQRCEVSQRVTRYWPVASPQVDSDHDVTDPVQPLLIVSSASNGVID